MPQMYLENLMNSAQVLRLMKIELECITRQDTPKCVRYTEGCNNCDLVQTTDNLIQAYEYVINKLTKEIEDEQRNS